VWKVVEYNVRDQVRSQVWDQVEDGNQNEAT
jgi:hypothetical protein